jgi:hypothetical protein
MSLENILGLLQRAQTDFEEYTGAVSDTTD